MVDGTPVLEDGLERGFDFPILDEVLDELRKRASFVRLLLCLEIVSFVTPMARPVLLTLREDLSCL